MHGAFGGENDRQRADRVLHVSFKIGIAPYCVEHELLLALAQLLVTGLIVPTEGSCRINDIPLQNIALESWRSHIAW